MKKRALILITPIFIAFVVIGFILSTTMPVRPSDNQFSKFFLAAGIFCFALLGAISSRQRNGKWDLLQARVVLNPKISYVIALAAYFGFSVIELTIWEARASIDQFYYIYTAVIAFMIGSAIIEMTFSTKKVSSRRIQFNIENLRIALAVVALIGVTGFISIARSGLPMFAESVQLARVSHGGYISYMSFVFSDIAIMILVARIVGQRSVFGNRWVDYVAVIMCLFVMFAMGSRARMIYPILVPYFFYVLYKSRKINLNFILLSVITASILFFVGAYRISLDLGLDVWLAVGTKLFGELNLPSYTLGKLMQEFPDNIPFLDWTALTWGVLAVLPYEVTVLTTYLGEVMPVSLVGTGFTPTLIGGFYIMGGVGSVFFGLFIFGALMQWGYRRMVRYETPGVTLFYAYLFVYAMNCMKGGFLKDVEPIWHLAVLSFIYIVSRAKVKPCENSECTLSLDRDQRS